MVSNFPRVFSIGLGAAALLTLPITAAKAAIVAPGFDLLVTTQALIYFPDGNNVFQSHNLLGVPLGSYNFPPLHGTKQADTIIHRLEEASAPPNGSDMINIEMVALQLKSDGAIDLLGNVAQFYFTQSAIPSLGTMTIHFNSLGSGGTYDSTLNVNFDVRVGGFDGQIVGQFAKTLFMTGSPWYRGYEGRTNGIPGINYHLNGSNIDADFWSGTNVIHDSGDGFTHVVDPIPEPGTWAMLIVGFGLVGAAARRRQRYVGAA